ncbi:rhodanese-like domain-containing protein [Pseudooctadecabacter sp.]|uniref:rhodanese-like domain-containing protein n=1 Tax=Pseudooctadecabacter sp. TaxID=1966338 RepID=UPI0035C7C787
MPHPNADAIPRISYEEAQDLHGRDGVVFLDVREPAEVAAGKIAGAVAIPLGEVAARVDEVAGAQTVVVYCAAGARAATAGGLLREAGLADVRNAGGFRDWAEADGAVD